MASYVTSTQRQRWLFESADSLAEARSAAQAAVGADVRLERLTERDERGFEALYLEKMRQWCCASDGKVNQRLGPEDAARPYRLRLGTRLFWTAATLFKRLNLRRSMMHSDNNPFVMRAVAVYVAGKSEEIPLSLQYRGVHVEALAGLAVLDSAAIVENEIGFLGAVDFNLVMFHPYAALSGIIDALQLQHPADAALWNALDAGAVDVLEASLYTDACFLFSFARIAMAAVLVAWDEYDEHGQAQALVTREKLAEWIVPEGVEGQERAAIVADVERVAGFLAQGRNAKQELVDHIKHKNARARLWLPHWREKSKAWDFRQPSSKRKRA